MRTFLLPVNLIFLFSWTSAYPGISPTYSNADTHSTRSYNEFDLEKNPPVDDCQTLNKPEIQLRLLDKNGQNEYKTFRNIKNQQISIPGGKHFELKCISRNPVLFKFQGLMAHNKTLNVRKSRFGEGNSTNFCFQVVVTLQSTTAATGLYGCVDFDLKLSNKIDTNSSSIYIFAAGEEEPHRLLAGYNSSISIRVHNQPGQQSKDIIIPCLTNNPATKIHLLKNGKKIMSSDNKSHYNPMEGFILTNFSCGNNLNHNYSCSENENLNDTQHSLNFNVDCVEENYSVAKFDKKRFTNGNVSSAEYQCLESTRMTAVECHNLEECQFLTSCRNYPLQTICKGKIVQTCKDAKENCHSIKTSQKDKFRGMLSCSNGDNMAVAYVFSDIKGEKAWHIDFDTGISAPARKYNKWLSLTSTDFNTLSNVNKFIQHDTIRFQCNASKVLTAGDGIEWMFQLRNGSLVDADVSDETLLLANGTNGIYINSAKISFNHPEITALICRAPLFYSNLWANYSHPVAVTPHIPQRLLGDTRPEWEELEGDKNITLIWGRKVDLTCNAYGSDVAFEWRRNGLEIDPDSHEFVTRSQTLHTYDIISSTITVEYDDTLRAANYTCTTFDPVSKKGHTKLFQVTYNRGINYLAIGLILGAMFIFFTGILVVGFKNRKFISDYLDVVKARKTFYDGDLKLKGSIEGESFKQEFKIEETNITICETLLSFGNFGEVYEATLKRNDTSIVQVVVKTLPKQYTLNNFREFLKEVKFHQDLNHDNIVKVFGAVMKENRQTPKLVFERLNGDLESGLRRLNKFTDQVNPVARNSYAQFGLETGLPEVPFEPLPPISTTNLFQWSYQVADAMDYLTREKGRVHRDLAARNILVSYPELVAKIGDFGFSRMLQQTNGKKNTDRKYYVHILPPSSADTPFRKLSTPDAIPVRWLAIEILEALRKGEAEQKYSVYTDIWAFGVLVWELFSHCETMPYDYEDNNYDDDTIVRECANFFHYHDDDDDDDKKLPKPFFANREIWSIMKRCWALEKEKRPSFLELKNLIKSAENRLNGNQNSPNETPI